MDDKKVEFLERIERAVNQFHVKAKLAEMEAQAAREKLAQRYEALRERLDALRKSDRWQSLKDDAEAALERLKETLASLKQSGR